MYLAEYSNWVRGVLKLKGRKSLARATCFILFFTANFLCGSVPALAIDPSQTITLKSLGLTQKERDWLASHKTVKIGIDGGYAPYSFMGRNGGFVGVAPDYLTRIGAITGLTFEAVPDLSWPQIVEGARRRTLDVIATAVRTPERDAFLNFTKIYIPTPLVVTTRKKDKKIGSSKDLAGNKIALVEKYSSSQRVLKEHPGIQPYFVQKPLEGLRMVASGEADGYVGVLGVNSHLATEHGLANLKHSTRYDLITNGQRFGVRKDWPELTSILDKALTRISTREKNEILAFWIPTSTDNLDFPVFDLTDEEKAWLKAHPTINIGMMDSWPPMDFLDSSGQPKGIGAEFINAINIRLGGVLKMISGPWDKIFLDAKEKRLDAIMGITPQFDREPFFNFTQPYVVVPHVIFGRADGPRFNSLSDIRGKTVSAERGFFIVGVLREKYPRIEIKEYDSTSDALDAVAKGDADAYVGNRAVATYIIHNELIGNVQEHVKIRETESVNAMGVRKDWPILHRILQKALASITVRERRAILKNWISVKSGRGSPHLNLTSEEWVWLSNHPVIRVAGDRNWRPVEFIGANGRFQGLAVDYLDRMGRMLGVSFKFDMSSSWGTAVRKLEDRKLDMFSAAAPTDNRNKFAIFTKPYLGLPAVIFGHADTRYINGVAGLRGKKVAVIADYAIVDYLRKHNPDISLLEVRDASAGLRKVRSGEVDAYIGNILMTSYVIRKFGFGNIRVVGATPYQIDVSMAARSDWPILHTILQKALDAIADEEKSSFESRWLGIQVEQPPDYTIFWQLAGGGGLVLILFFCWNWYLRGKTLRQQHDLLEANTSLRQEIVDRREAEDSLRRVQKMEAVGQLTGGVAHDFNNMMAIMLGSTEMLEINVEKTPVTEKNIKRIKDTISRAASLTHRLLAFSRQQTLSPMMTDVKGLIDSLEDMLRRTIGETIIFNFMSAQNLWPAFIDGSQLDHALINLAINARDAMPNGGHLTIEVANATLDQTYANSHEDVSPGDYVQITVSDTGHGMTDQVLEKAFDPFYTTKDVGKGSGLGLSMVYGFVKQSKGHIAIYSEPDHGTAIKLYFPRSLTSDVKVEAEPDTSQLAPGTERILIVEDDPELRKIPSEILCNQGYQVVAVKDGRDAIKCMQEGPAFDLLFTDIVLPGGLNGVEIAEKAIQLLPAIKVLYTTGYAANHITNSGKMIEKEMMLEKPYQSAELLRKVRATLDGVRG